MENKQKKIAGGDGASGFKKNQVLAVSTRLEEIKKNDSMLSIDLVDHFKASMLKFMNIHQQ